METNSVRAAFIAALVAAALALGLSGCGVLVRDPTAPASTSALSSNAPRINRPGPADSPTPPQKTAQPAPTYFEGACDSRDFTVDADESTLLLDGACGLITITASDVYVTVGSAKSVIIEGNDVTVLAEAGVEVLSVSGSRSYVEVNDAVGSVTIEGSTNELILSGITTLTLIGDGNYVQWSGKVGRSTDTGSGNTVTGP